TILHELFPHKSIPHYVLINKGNVIAVTDGSQINKEIIQRLIEGEDSKLETKKEDMTFDFRLPLFVNGNGGQGINIEYRSILSGPIEGVGKISTVLSPKSQKLLERAVSTNATIVQLFKMVYHEVSRFPDNRIIIEIDNPLIRQKLDNKYCYELMMPASPVTVFRNKMIMDLEEYFGLHASTELREVECWIMGGNGNIKKSYSKGGNAQNNLMMTTPSGRVLQNEGIDRLANFLDRQLELPVINETYENNNVDITLPNDIKDLKALSIALNKQGLELHKETRSVNVFVITDNQK